MKTVNKNVYGQQNTFYIQEHFTFQIAACYMPYHNAKYSKAFKCIYISYSFRCTPQLNFQRMKLFCSFYFPNSSFDIISAAAMTWSMS